MGAPYRFGPDRAITTVSESGRTPDEAVKAGNATREGLLGLLRSIA